MKDFKRNMDEIQQRYEEDFLKLAKEMYDEKFYLVRVGFGSYEYSWCSVIFAPFELGCEIIQSKEKEAQRLICNLISLPSGMSRKTIEKINSLFESRELSN